MQELQASTAPAGQGPAALPEAASLEAAGYVALPAPAARARFDAAGTALAGPAWESFAASWAALEPDRFMADGGRYRLRRHAAFRLAPGTAPQRLPHRPHYQTTEHNPLNGGIERWFAPVTPEAEASPALAALLEGARAVFDALRPGTDWLVEMHQFRIQARTGEAGKPTPEGMHRDGVDFVMVTLVGRHNVAGGVTGIRIDGQPGEQSFTLEQPLDSVLLDDHRVWHGVTPIAPLDPDQPGYRDVLVLTFSVRLPPSPGAAGRHTGPE
ncbi:2OG-Fe dioxygenase family protein [Roseomonas sp. GC11]|uniref:2OG-Fe dioxygenase family protein n=1 Tax=Roseomonas sp. GC11 TaxID=2950546 RepID=UPI0021097022|nr:2OG-Fe dioxygenase family protein [Roseomonas sp. GC11]MCQ4160723.1 2OG-Fe dioxygenase family protein [Roseomonas sp. GC11]